MRKILRALASWLLAPALALGSIVIGPAPQAAAATCAVSATPDGRPMIQPSASGPGTGKKIGFDNTHGETAGAADWVIDGSYAGMACAIAAQGYTVEEIRAYPLTVTTLATYDAVVIPEPNIPFTTAEHQQLEQYVAGGGGLFLIADHYQADRNLNTWDSPEIFNGFRRGHYGTTFSTPYYNYLHTTNTTYTFNDGTDWLAQAFGFRFRYNAIDLVDDNANPIQPGDPNDPTNPGILPPAQTYGLTNGVTSMGIYAGATISIVDPAKAMGIVYLNKGAIKRWNNAPADDPEAIYTDNVGPAACGAVMGGTCEGAYVAVAKPGLGKVAALGDSSPFESKPAKYRREDSGGTKNVFEDWSIKSHAQLGINLVNWLATPDSATSIDPALRQSATPQASDPTTVPQHINEPWNTPPSGYLWYDASTFAAGAYNGTNPPGTIPTESWALQSLAPRIYPGNKMAVYLNGQGLAPNSSISNQLYMYLSGGTQIANRYNRSTQAFAPGLTAQTLTADGAGKLQRWEFLELTQAAATRSASIRYRIGSENKITQTLSQEAGGTYGYLTVESALGYSDGLHAFLFTKNGALDTVAGTNRGTNTTVTLPPGTYTLDIMNDAGAVRSGVTVNVTAGQTTSLAQILTPAPADWDLTSVPANAYPGNKLALYLDGHALGAGSAYSTQAYATESSGGAPISQRYDRSTQTFSGASQSLTADGSGNIGRWEFWALDAAGSTRTIGAHVFADGAAVVSKSLNQVATGSFGALNVEASLGYSNGLHAFLFTKSGALDTAAGVNRGADTAITLPAGAYTLDIVNDAGAVKSGVAVTIAAGQTVSLAQLLAPKPVEAWNFDPLPLNTYPGNKLAARLDAQGLASNAAVTHQAYVYVNGGLQISKRYNRSTGTFVDGLTSQTLTTDGAGNLERWEFWELAGATVNRDLNVRARVGSTNKVTKPLKQVNVGAFGYLTVESSLGWSDGLHAALFTKGGALDTAVWIASGADTTVTLPAGSYTMAVHNDAGVVRDSINVTITAGQTVSLFTLLDNVAPTISSEVSPAPSQYGWYNTDVTVAFTCADTESGIASCPSPVVLSGEGADQSVTGTAADHVGNTASATVAGINIDKTTPTIEFTGKATYAPDEQITISCTAADALSGIELDPCGVLVDAPAYSFSPGEHTVAVTAADKAGNQVTSHFAFTVTGTLESLGALTDRLVEHQGMATSLRNMLTKEHDPIDAYLKHLRQHAGKQIPADVAATLEALAMSMLD